MSYFGDAKVPGDVESTAMFAASGIDYHSTLAAAAAPK